MHKINNLTLEQEKLLEVYRDKWMKIGLCTKPADRPKAEQALCDAYEIAGLTKPKQIIWTTSPLAGSILVSILKDEELMKDICGKLNAKKFEVGDSVWGSIESSVGDSVRSSVGDSVRSSVWDSVWDSVGDSVGDSVWSSVWDSVGDSVRSSVWSSVWDSVWDSVGDSVRSSVRSSVGDSVGGSVRSSVGDSVWSSVWDSVGDSVWDSVRSSVVEAIFGQQDANWLGFYNYFLEVLNLKEECAKLIPLMNLAKHSNWVYPYKNIAVISEKPKTCTLRNGVIHNETGPAIEYVDGFSIYALQGIRIPEWLIETEKEDISVEKILKMDNTEQRRVAMKYIGFHKFEKDLKAEIIDTKDEYTLMTFEYEGERVGPYLKMKDSSSDRIFVEGVGDPVEEGVNVAIKTIDQALEWRAKKAAEHLLTNLGFELEIEKNLLQA